MRGANTSALWPRMFAFNFLVVAQKEDELVDIYERTEASADATFPPTRSDAQA